MERSKLFNFRISEGLAKALAQAAERSEVSQSHFIREAIKAQIARAKDNGRKKAA